MFKLSSTPQMVEFLASKKSLVSVRLPAAFRWQAQRCHIEIPTWMYLGSLVQRGCRKCSYALKKKKMRSQEWQGHSRHRY